MKYKQLSLSIVPEACRIVQLLGSLGEFQSTINPSDLECQNTVDHIREMRHDITNKYAVYANKYAVRYMNHHWETNNQVKVKIRRWPDAVKYLLHSPKDVNDPRWPHIYKLKAGLTHLDAGSWIICQKPTMPSLMP